MTSVSVSRGERLDRVQLQRASARRSRRAAAASAPGARLAQRVERGRASSVGGRRAPSASSARGRRSRARRAPRRSAARCRLAPRPHARADRPGRRASAAARRTGRPARRANPGVAADAASACSRAPRDRRARRPARAPAGPAAAPRTPARRAMSRISPAKVVTVGAEHHARRRAARGRSARRPRAVGTTSTGSRGSAARKRVQHDARLGGVGRTGDQRAAACGSIESRAPRTARDPRAQAGRRDRLGDPCRHEPVTCAR